MKEQVKVIHRNVGGGGGAVYGLGFLGSLFYYIQNMNSLGDFVFGVVKSFLWPAFVVYHILDFLKI